MTIERKQRLQRIIENVGSALTLDRDGERVLRALADLTREEAVICALIAGSGIGALSLVIVGAPDPIRGGVKAAELLRPVMDAVDARERAEAGAISV